MKNAKKPQSDNQNFDASKSKLLKERELAARWDVSPKTLQAKRQNGKGPKYRKIGGAVRYALVDVIAFEEASGRSSTSDPGNTER